MRDFTAIVPAHNEEVNIEEIVEELKSELSELDFEIIIVEDGCTDSTQEISKRISSENQQVKHLHFQERLGKGEAITRGFENSEGKIIGFIDADMVESVGNIMEMYNEVLSGSDVVIGSRYTENSESQRSMKRKIPSLIYNKLADGLLDTGIKDHQCGLKLFRKEVWEAVSGDIDQDTWFWDTEFLFSVRKKGYSIKEIGIKWSKNGESKVNLFSAGPQMLFKLLKLSNRKTISRNRFLRFITIGAIGALINTTILYLIGEYTSIYYLYGSFIGIETAIIAMFFLNNYFTFESTKRGIEIFQGIIKSNGIRSVGIIANIGLLYFFTEILGIYYILSNIIAIGLAAVINYLGESRLNWKE